MRRCIIKSIKASLRSEQHKQRLARINYKQLQADAIAWAESLPESLLTAPAMLGIRYGDHHELDHAFRLEELREGKVIPRSPFKRNV